MNMPSKGTPVTVEGYGTGIFVGATALDDPDKAAVLLKFEHEKRLREGYGRGIVSIPIDEYEENRIYREQLPSGKRPDVSTEKLDAVLSERFDE
jgi:hypothetical protein